MPAMSLRPLALISVFALPLAAAAQTPPAAPTPSGPQEMIPNPPRNLLKPDMGKLPLTGGFSDVDGAGGGGLVPWALITGHGTEDSYGFNGHVTDVQLEDFDLRSYGAGIGVMDRFELSFTRHELDVTGTALEGVEVSQDIVGLKVRLAGDAVYGQDSWLPQIAIGAQIKKHRGIDNAGPLTSVRQLGAKYEDGTDFYLSGTKVFLAQSLLVNVTLRHTKANQLGLLGFGGDENDSRKLQFETTVGYLVTRKLAVGGEYRSKPDSLGVDREGDAWDLFVAWAPSRHVSVVGAYVNLGNILGPATGVNRDQKGTYLSLQFGF
jgi:hypothetical protein